MGALDEPYLLVGVPTMAGRLLFIREKDSGQLVDLITLMRMRFLDHHIRIRIDDFGRYTPQPEGDS